MEGIGQLLKEELQGLIDKIDAGGSRGNEEEMVGILMAIRKYNHKDEYFTKYQACKYLNGISRATFDNLVAAGKIPQGEKLYAGDNNLFWKVSDLRKYKQSKKHS